MSERRWIKICLLFYILATSKVKSRLVPTCDSTYSCLLYSASLMGGKKQATSQHDPTQSHYPDAEPTSSCPILIMHWFDSTRTQTHEVRIRRSLKPEDGRSTHLAISSGHWLSKFKYASCRTFRVGLIHNRAGAVAESVKL